MNLLAQICIILVVHVFCFDCSAELKSSYTLTHTIHEITSLIENNLWKLKLVFVLKNFIWHAYITLKGEAVLSYHQSHVYDVAIGFQLLTSLIRFQRFFFFKKRGIICFKVMLQVMLRFVKLSFLMHLKIVMTNSDIKERKRQLQYTKLINLKSSHI